MVCPNWCGCGFWCTALFRKCCCCCPAECEYRCCGCLVTCSRFIYCLQKALQCILDIPIRFIKGILHWFCCAGCFALLVIFLVLGLLAILYRILCETIMDFLLFLYEGISPLFVANLVTNVIYNWNVMVPYISFGVQLAVDLEMTIYDNMVSTLGHTGIDLLIQDLMESSYVISNIILGVLLGLCESNPSDLVGLSEISKDLTIEVISNQEILIPIFQWVTGPLFDIMVPLSQSILHLLTLSTFVVASTGRTLLEFNEMNAANSGTFGGNSGIGSSGIKYDYTTYNGGNYDKFSKINNDMASSYVKELQNSFRTLRSENDLNTLIKNAKDITEAKIKIEKQKMKVNPNTFKDKDDNRYPTDSNAKFASMNENDIKNRQFRLRTMTSIIKDNAKMSISKLNGNTLPGIKTPVQWFGFRDLKHMNEHLKNTYGDGKGFVSSFAPHKHPIFKHMKKNENQIHFSEYMENNNYEPKDFSKHGLMGENNNVMSRKLLGIVPPILPPPLDCFTVFPFPVDPFCILEFIFDIPIDTPPWLEPFVEFDCECDNYDDDGLSGCPGNALTVLQTLISLIFSIDPLDDLVSGTLPSFIEDNLFLDTPGDAPDGDDIVCAIIHLDCFFLIATPIIILLTGLLYTLGFICTCFNIIVELQILNEHQKLVEKIIGSEDLGKAYDRLFEANAGDSMLNPGIYCYGNKDIFPNQTYWIGPDNKLSFHESLEDIRVRKTCFENFATKSCRSKVTATGMDAKQLADRLRLPVPKSIYDKKRHINKRLFDDSFNCNTSKQPRSTFGSNRRDESNDTYDDTISDRNNQFISSSMEMNEYSNEDDINRNTFNYIPTQDDINSNNINTSNTRPIYAPKLPKHIATTQIQQQLVYKAVTNKYPNATHKDIQKYYHMIYPEDKEISNLRSNVHNNAMGYNSYRKLLKSIKNEFGNISNNILTHKEYIECHEAHIKPYMHYELTQSFNDDLNKHLSETNTHGVISKHIHVHNY